MIHDKVTFVSWRANAYTAAPFHSCPMGMACSVEALLNGMMKSLPFGVSPSIATDRITAPIGVFWLVAVTYNACCPGAAALSMTVLRPLAGTVTVLDVASAIFSPSVPHAAMSTDVGLSDVVASMTVLRPLAGTVTVLDVASAIFSPSVPHAAMSTDVGLSDVVASMSCCVFPVVVAGTRNRCCNWVGTHDEAATPGRSPSVAHDERAPVAPVPLWALSTRVSSTEGSFAFCADET